MSKKPLKPANGPAFLRGNSPLCAVCRNGSDWLLAIVFSLAVCLSSLSTIRGAALFSLTALAVSAVLCMKTLRERITLPVLALTLFVVMCGISTFYADSGKFALQEFLKVLFAYCTALSLLAVAPKDRAAGGRWIATILAGAVSVISLASIDLLSTHFISDPVVAFLSLFSDDYANLGIVEAGTRMLSLIEKPNVYAGVAGIGVLLSLGLSSSEPAGRRRTAYLCFLYVNALGFLLSFSMGASAMIALAFVVYLLTERKDHRGSLLILMVETLLLTLCGVFPIAATALVQWDGIQPIPLACAVLGAALLCLLDRFVGSRLANKLQTKGKLVLILVAAVLILALLFAAAAYNLTGAATLSAGESMRRSVYPESGDYAVSAQSSGKVNVTVISQNRQDTMMHTSTQLYKGELSTASFTVPEDSTVVYMTFSAAEDALLEEVLLQSNGANYAVPLNYRLLPDFISNRLQGMFANQNAIQRTVFFEDGLELFARSPIVGLGMGAYENGIRSVQSFAYDTKYAHNHYIQVLAETGIVGLILFVGTLLTAAFALFRARKQETAHLLLPALGAALVFMAGHAAVEVTFSFYAFLPFAFGTFALIALCAGDSIAIPFLNKTAKNLVISITAILLCIFTFFLVRNMQAKAMTNKEGATSADLVQAAAIDKFEWADYALSYVVGIPDDPSDYIRAQADAYAARLSKLDSNSVPRYLIQYYFKTGQTANAFAMAEKYVDYVAASPDTWQTTFDIIMFYPQDTAEYRTSVLRLAEKLEAWNTANMGTIELEPITQAFIKSMEEGK